MSTDSPPPDQTPPPGVSHLDDLAASLPAGIGRSLVMAFRTMLRDPAVSQNDYSARVRILLDATVQEDAVDAPP